MINVYTDGGARGNPGPAAIGVYITDKKNNLIHSFGKKIGVATNNVAEYKAVIAALAYLAESKEKINPAPFFHGVLTPHRIGAGLTHAKKITTPTHAASLRSRGLRPKGRGVLKRCWIKSQDIHFFLDSKLVVSQINGIYKIKNANLRDLLFKIYEKESELSSQIEYSYIPREKNKNADKLVNDALDNLL